MKDRIKKYRIVHGLSGEALAKLVGVMDSTIGEWEKGTVPKGEKLLRLEMIMREKNKEIC